MAKIKYRPNPVLGAWLKAATPSMKKALYALIASTPVVLWQHVSGRRNMSAEKAGRVEQAMQTIAKSSREAPTPLTRGMLCDACSKCSYYLNSIKK